MKQKRIINRILSISIAMCFSLQLSFSNLVGYADSNSDFTGYTAISTKAQLYSIKNDMSGKYYLTNDIEFTTSDFASGGSFYNKGAGWIPIGGESYFTGILDGNGYKIKGLYMNFVSGTSSFIYVGLFGRMWGGTIKNLGITNISISAKASLTHGVAYTGGIVGDNDSGTLINCYSTGTLNTTVSSSCFANVGGLIGYNNSNGIISNCYSSVSVNAIASSERAFAGGIVGNNYGTVISSYNLGTVTALSTTNYSCVGGIAGYNNQNATISYCYNNCPVGSNSSTLNYMSYIGGISGYNDGIVSNCYNTAAFDLSLLTIKIGGIVGYNFSSIVNCYNTGHIKIKTTSSYGFFGGGIAGHNYGMINGCLNTGNITIDSLSNAAAGGISGLNNRNISMCYNVGNIIITSASSNYAGGISGTNNETISDCYYLNQINKGVDYGEDTAIPLSVQQLSMPEFFAGFDFVNTWQISDQVNLLCLKSIPFVINKLTDIQLKSQEVSLAISEVYLNSVELSPSSPDIINLTYQSLDESIATVDSSGTITGISLGTTYIIVTDNYTGISNFCTVNVIQKVSQITVSGKSTVGVGRSVQLTAQVLPQNATNKTVVWRSGDSSVATVADDCTVRGIKSGQVTIYASSSDGAVLNVPYVISVVVLAESIALNKSQTVLSMGSSETLSVTVTPNDATNQSVIWSSDNTDVAAVSQGGVVTALKEGTAKVSVKLSDDSLTAECIVTVVKMHPQSILLNKSETTLRAGLTEALTATVLPSDTTDKSVIWSSSNTAVATISQTGVVTAVSGGNATITVQTIDGGLAAFCVVTVLQPVTGVTVDRTTITAYTGGMYQLNPSVAPANATNKTVTYTLNNSCVTVDSTGKISAISVGSALITVKTTDGNKTAFCVVTVKDSKITSNTYYISDTAKLINGISIKTPLSTALSFLTSSENIVALGKNDIPLSTGNYIGTGTKLQRVSENQVVYELTAVVEGDITGDGESNVLDLIEMKNDLLGKQHIEGIYFTAADLTKDNEINILDVLSLKDTTIQS